MLLNSRFDLKWEFCIHKVMPTFNGLEIIISFYTASLLLIYGIGGVESFKTQKDRQDLS